jgi:hypothetical protein
MTGHRLAHHLAGPRVERGVERERAATDVLEAMALGAARGQRQHGERAIECLDRGLLVDAEYDCVLGRVDVESDHVRRLGLEVGVVGGDIAVQVVRLESSSGPDPGDPHVADPQFAAKLARGPVSAAIGWLLLGQSQDSGLQPLRVGTCLTASMPPVERFEATLQEPSTPQADGRLAATELVGNGTVGDTIGQKEDEPSALGVRSSQAASTNPGAQLLTLQITQNDGLECRVHSRIVSRSAPEMGVTVH